MKKFKCPDCDEMFESETSEEMLNILMPHYMEKYHEIMAKGTEESKAVWMKQFHEDWEKV